MQLSKEYDDEESMRLSSCHENESDESDVLFLLFSPLLINF